MTWGLVGALVAVAVWAWPGRAHRPSGLSPRASGGAWAPARHRPGVGLIMARLRHPDRAEGLAREAAYCEMLALALRAGLPPPAALEIADPSHPPDAGGPTRGGRLLRLAWEQSESLGTPLAEAVATCAEARQADHDHELRRRAASAGPRASMILLTALPVVGPLLATLAGLGPDVTDPVVAGMVAAGVAATGLGWWWARALLARADRPVLVVRAQAADQHGRTGRPVVVERARGIVRVGPARPPDVERGGRSS